MASTSVISVENTKSHLETQTTTFSFMTSTSHDDDLFNHIEREKNKSTPAVVYVTNNNTDDQQHQQQHQQQALKRSYLEEAVNDFNVAKNKDFERILTLNYPELILKRESVYNEAQLNNITVESSANLRCAVVRKIVEWLFTTIEPPDAYTKATDCTHFKDVGDLATEMFYARNNNNNNIEMPVSLLLSAWFHDIERFLPATKCRYLPESVDHIRKQAIHALTSARVCEVILNGAPISPEEKERIFNLILHHDYPSRDPLIILGQTLIDGVSDELEDDWTILQSADSLTFFKRTIVRFVEYKSAKNTPVWIWTRVMNNIRRLRPSLQQTAIESIRNLSDDIKTKMGFNNNDLQSFS